MRAAGQAPTTSHGRRPRSPHARQRNYRQRPRLTSHGAARCRCHEIFWPHEINWPPQGVTSCANEHLLVTSRHASLSKYYTRLEWRNINTDNTVWRSSNELSWISRESVTVIYIKTEILGFFIIILVLFSVIKIHRDGYRCSVTSYIGNSLSQPE